ncbi:gfo/Idh/MocA family oxidoreductase [Brevibacillus sp. AY1]|uniref:Gfo/Idh/MocA family protein n=1 Tax=Brevibacillus sp. AY1 TaxID=2807621 RepID=UPI002456237F|nr:gfo/Idh/MocA family oxidoreductase [Brevibacillus sp. AY1]MDH4618265.1 Gfo/Idh/MocA family oxidoreductase [Brevibacillus sp. AY1]
MRALVIGFGSIGMRHARLLQELGCRVSVVSCRQIEWHTTYASITQALQAEDPQYVVVANKTAEHHNSLSELSKEGFAGKVLVEKPLFHDEIEMPPYFFENIFVGYNLRFHPGIQKLRDLLKEQVIHSLHVYTGQYLPDWRPLTDYRNVYSAKKSEGGGVLRDLSHELDYVNWLTGGWKSVTAIGGHFSNLEIDSDDVYSILLQTTKCPAVSIHINYLDRCPIRHIIANTNAGTIKVDLIHNTLSVNEKTETYEVNRDFTYIAQHKAVMYGRAEDVCQIVEASEVMSMIKGIEEANQKRSWVFR